METPQAEAHAWTMALLTAAHFDLPEYGELAASPPPGGISALTALALAGIQTSAEEDGVCADAMIFNLAVITADPV